MFHKLKDTIFKILIETHKLDNKFVFYIIVNYYIS